MGATSTTQMFDQTPAVQSIEDFTCNAHNSAAGMVGTAAVAHQLFSHLDPLIPPHGLPALDCLPVFIAEVKRHCLELVTSSGFLLLFLGFYLIFRSIRGPTTRHLLAMIRRRATVRMYQTVKYDVSIGLPRTYRVLTTSHTIGYVWISRPRRTLFAPDMRGDHKPAADCISLLLWAPTYTQTDAKCSARYIVQR